MGSWEAMGRERRKARKSRDVRRFSFLESHARAKRTGPRSLAGEAGWHLGDWPFVLSPGYMEHSLRKAERVLITHFVFPNRREEREEPH